MSNSNSKKVKMKITVIGDAASGKSSFIHNLVYNEYCMKYQSTINYQVTIYELKNNSINYQIHLWQCGANHFLNNKFIRKAFFKNSSATFLIFDLVNPSWKQQIVKWIEEAYNCQSFLVYGVGTKKDIFDRMKIQEKVELFKTKANTNNFSLFTQKGDEFNNDDLVNSYQFQNNMFFEQYGIKHYYQSAVSKIPYEIKNIFITINDDRQKLTRSSLARGTKFDNSLLQNYMSKYARDKQSFNNSKMESLSKSKVQSIKQQRFDLGSVRIQQVEQQCQQQWPKRN